MWYGYLLVTYSFCCFPYELLLMVNVPLPNASASQDFSWMCSSSFVAFWPLYVSWQPSYHCAFVSSDACCACGPSRHFISGCQEKQTPVPRPFLGPGQSVVSRRIWSVCNSCSVQPSGIASFISGRCAKFHDILGKVMLLLPIKASVPQISLRWLSNLSCNFIASKFKEVGVILSMSVITNCRSKKNLNPPPTLLLIPSFG
jgi:hypothetical protein